MGTPNTRTQKRQGGAQGKNRQKETGRRTAGSAGGQKKRKKPKKPVRQNARKGTAMPPATRWLRSARVEEGCEALVVVRERAGRAFDQAHETCSVDTGIGGPKTTGGGRASKKRRRRSGVPVNVCRALSAAGHVDRGRIMAKLLEGPATYRTLQKVTKLKAGPLYHHINQLRLAGLMLPKQRDLYELTRGGRNLILVVIAMGGLIRDPKRRPISPQ